ncbi:MAG: histone deacetylase [Elusimicrobiota bacterium]
MKLIYSQLYTIEVAHKFRTEKFQRTCELLIKKRVIKSENIIEPEMPREDDLLLAHSAVWVKKVLDMKLTPADQLTAEMPVNKDVIFAHLLHCGGTMLACDIALKEGLGLHCGGGGHHAHKNYGAGFCLINDLAVAAKKTLKNFPGKRILIIDLDAHQGDGTADIMAREKNVFTFSIHSKNIYPEKKSRSSMDIEMDSGTKGDVYNSILSQALERIFDSFSPQFVFYNAGADVYEKDTLGDLKLSLRDIEERDSIVFEKVRKAGLPLVLTLSGGYCADVDETVKIHFNTIKKAVEILGSN